MAFCFFALKRKQNFGGCKGTALYKQDPKGTCIVQSHESLCLGVHSLIGLLFHLLCSFQDSVMLGSLSRAWQESSMNERQAPFSERSINTMATMVLYYSLEIQYYAGGFNIVPDLSTVICKES